VPVSVYWKKGRAKIEIALAKGKQHHDKRSSTKEADWARDKARLFRNK
jgi:SsrA-binding protein